MSLDNARVAYPLLVRLANELAAAARERRNVNWISYDEFCTRCRELGLNETPRTIANKVLKPLQAACLERGLPDLSALVIQKPKSRTDFGNLLRPSDGWWEAYTERDGISVGDVTFWFNQYRAARDYSEWPEAPFF